MIEAAAGVSVPLIAIIFVLQLVLPALAKRRAAKEPVDPATIKEAAILGHQVAEIDKRTQEMNGTLRELVAVNKEMVVVNREVSDTVRDNTRATEKLTNQLER